MPKHTSDWRRLARECRRQGLVVDRSGRHPRVYRPNQPHTFVTLVCSASDHRSILNAIALLRRQFGFRWKGH